MRSHTLCISFVLAIFIWSSHSYANSKTVIQVPLTNGKSLKVDVHSYLNERKVLEYKLTAHDLTEALIGFARDLDGNGTVETFFLLGDDGLHIYERKVSGEKNILKTKKVLTQHAGHFGKKYYRKLATNLLSYLFMSVSKYNDAQVDYFRDRMDLEELRMALEKNKRILTKEEYAYGYDLMVEGHLLAFERLRKAVTKDTKLFAAADVAMWLSGGVLLKGATKSVSAVKAINTQGLRRQSMGVATALGIRFTTQTYKASLHNALAALTAKRVLNASKGVLLKGLSNIRAEWKYIALSTGIQIGVESYVNYEEVYDADPEALAQNLLHHKGIQENVSISLTDTILMTGASATVKNRVARYALLGMIGAGSSAAVGSALGGSQSKERVVFDTAWSAGIDTAQLLIDLHVLHKFQTLAVKHKNPKLKVVGYAIVFVGQVGAYYGYAKAAKWIDPETDLKEGEVVLVPVTVAAR